VSTAPSNTPPAQAKPARWPLLLVIVLLLALAGVSAGWYLSTRQGDAPAVAAAPKPLLPAPALYFALEPAFVVNLKTNEFEAPHYLQAEVQLMTRDARVHAALAEHAPALRANPGRYCRTRRQGAPATAGAGGNPRADPGRNRQRSH